MIPFSKKRIQVAFFKKNPKEMAAAAAADNDNDGDDNDDDDDDDDDASGQ